MKESKILVSDSRFLECVDELATQITEMKFGDGAYSLLSEIGKIEENNYIDALAFSEEAQDYYNEMFDEYETLLNNTLNVWNKQGEIEYICSLCQKFTDKITYMKDFDNDFCDVCVYNINKTNIMIQLRKEKKL